MSPHMVPGALAPKHKGGTWPCHEVTAASKVLTLSFPTTCQDFTEQFQVLLPKDVQPCREAIAALLEKLQVDGRNYQIGKTKVSTATPGRHSTPTAPMQHLTLPSVPHTALKGLGRETLSRGRDTRG